MRDEYHKTHCDSLVALHCLIAEGCYSSVWQGLQGEFNSTEAEGGSWQLTKHRSLGAFG